jgi:hypothetical protein
VPFLVELIAEDHRGDGERADEEVENVTIHSLMAPLTSRTRALTQNETQLLIHV